MIILFKLLNMFRGEWNPLFFKKGDCFSWSRFSRWGFRGEKNKGFRNRGDFR